MIFVGTWGRTMDKEGLLLKKGGTLLKYTWVYDEHKKKGEFVGKDVTRYAYQKMFETCELEEGVTLRDVFLMLNEALDMWDLILCNWLKEIVTEGLTKEPGSDLHDGLQYVTLHWGMGYDSQDSNRLGGYAFPNFSGWGSWSDPHDKVEGWIGIDFTPAQNLMPFELRLKQEVVIDDDWAKTTEKTTEKTVTYEACTYTLGHIVQGIIWEMSFSGSPTRRDEVWAKIENDVEDIKNGTAELVKLDLSSLDLLAQE